MGTSLLDQSLVLCVLDLDLEAAGHSLGRDIIPPSSSFCALAQIPSKPGCLCTCLIISLGLRILIIGVTTNNQGLPN